MTAYSQRCAVGRAAVAAALMVLSLAACSSTHTQAAPTRALHSSDVTPGGTSPRTDAPSADVVAQNVTRCPLIATAVSADAVGMRLARIQQLVQAGQVVGCRFYALQGSPLTASEHLPGPNQPALEITSATYPDTVSAYNAAILATGSGPDRATYPVGHTVAGIVFRTRFDPTDSARDWALAFAKGRTVVIVRSAVTDTSLDVRRIGALVQARF